MKIVIVHDMWLTGFDAPCYHAMCVDKPIVGHNLMQAIAGDSPNGSLFHSHSESYLPYPKL